MCAIFLFLEFQEFSGYGLLIIDQFLVVQIKNFPRRDSNTRPPAPHAGALPSCATLRHNLKPYQKQKNRASDMRTQVTLGEASNYFMALIADANGEHHVVRITRL